jgi:hypothetical protein
VAVPGYAPNVPDGSSRERSVENANIIPLSKKPGPNGDSDMALKEPPFVAVPCIPQWATKA